MIESELPASLAALIEAYSWTRDEVGCSDSTVYCLRGPDTLYLKCGGNELADEAARLRWLAAHVAVPAVRAFVERAPGTHDAAWLLMDALPGQSAYDLLAKQASDKGSGSSSDASAHGRAEVVDAIVRYLKRLHAIPIAACPFDASHEQRLTLARARMEAGLVDEDDFDEERKGQSAAQVWQAMTTLLPFAAERVVVHGDFSLDNIFLQNGEVSGCIDVGRAGIGDPYQDLAILWNCLGEFGPELQQQMWRSYGIDKPDQRKLRFHLTLDEFF